MRAYLLLNFQVEDFRSGMVRSMREDVRFTKDCLSESLLDCQNFSRLVTFLVDRKAMRCIALVVVCHLLMSPTLWQCKVKRFCVVV